jgi:hypothetical protein
MSEHLIVVLSPTRIDEETFASLKMLAEREQLQFAQVIRRALRAYVAQHNPEGTAR